MEASRFKLPPDPIAGRMPEKKEKGQEKGRAFMVSERTEAVMNG